MSSNFSYDQAFDRNIGWISSEEQGLLRTKRVAIAGLGGVGGFHLLTLARLGIGRFSLAEFDTFDLVNFNRQAGASMDTIGRDKLGVMCEQARGINPELKVRMFADGVHERNVAEFLDGADLYVDGLDFFAFDARQLVFSKCEELGIPIVTVAPLGMGAALLNFVPGEMTFEDYFRFGDHSEAEKALRFFIGLAPARLQMEYLVDPSRVDLVGKRGPSSIIGCMLCAGIAGAEAIKILTGRGDVRAAPWSLQYDSFLNRLTRLYRSSGNDHPRQRRAIAQARRMLGLD